MIVLDVIRESWGWTGLEPAEIIAANLFGNVIVRARDGAYWRIWPEELACTPIAADAAAYERVWADDEFQLDWQMTRLVELALAVLGPVEDERCYCLKLPAVLGGAYDATNFGTIRRRELIAGTGYLAEQVKDVPDGGQVIIKPTE